MENPLNYYVEGSSNSDLNFSTDMERIDINAPVSTCFESCYSDIFLGLPLEEEIDVDSLDITEVDKICRLYEGIMDRNLPVSAVED